MKLLNEIKGFTTVLQQESWKTARWGILTFCFVHFIFEIGSGNEKNLLIPVILNYFISAWYVKKNIKEGKFQTNPFVSGLFVSCIVFIIRLILGFIFSHYMATK